jgi:hypothetical protein
MHCTWVIILMLNFKYNNNNNCTIFQNYHHEEFYDSSPQNIQAIVKLIPFFSDEMTQIMSHSINRTEHKNSLGWTMFSWPVIQAVNVSSTNNIVINKAQHYLLMPSSASVTPRSWRWKQYCHDLYNAHPVVSLMMVPMWPKHVAYENTFLLCRRFLANYFILSRFRDVTIRRGLDWMIGFWPLLLSLETHSILILDGL